VLRQSCLDTTARPLVQLFLADTQTWDREEVDRIDVPENGLVFSYDHQVLVIAS
jgi:hypothetical protein